MFDVKQFGKAKFLPRTTVIKVPTMAEFFSEGEPAEFTVRGLTGQEMSLCNEAWSKRANIEIIASAGQLTDEHKHALQQIFGNTTDLSADVVKRIEILHIVYPDAGRPVWIKLADAYPTVFYELTNAILNLSGQGKAVEKPKPSGQTDGSEA